jgi:hypothetical protein
MQLKQLAIAISATIGLSACGGGSSGSGGTEAGSFSLGVSDSPADAQAVVIGFKQVVLKNEEGSISFNVNENGVIEQVNLLDYQGTALAPLVSGAEVPVGEYQRCIYMQNDETGAADTSYVETTATVEGLVTNSNGSCGGEGAEEEGTGRLFFNKQFEIAAGENLFVAEFNLHKGLMGPHGNKDYWTLKPTSVQLVNEAEIGAIKGEVHEQVIADCEAQAGGSEFANVVYLYAADAALELDPEDASIRQMVDFRPDEDLDMDTQRSPIAAARVQSLTDESGDPAGYGYEIGYVVAGEYSLGSSCLGQNDLPEEVNLPTDEKPFFLTAEERQVMVEQGMTTERNFGID